MIPSLRAWHKKKKEMVYFNLPESLYELAQDWDESIVMQSTGLKDRHGIEVFEGDIIRSTKVKKDKYGSYIAWSDDHAALVHRHFVSYVRDSQINKQDFEGWLEVAGNIHESPISE